MKSQSLIETLAVTVMEDVAELVENLSRVDSNVQEAVKKSQANIDKVNRESEAITRRLEEASRELINTLKDVKKAEKESNNELKLLLLKQSKKNTMLTYTCIIACSLLAGSFVYFTF